MNAICDAALVNACGAGIQSIGLSEVDEVLRDLGMASTKAEMAPPPAQRPAPPLPPVPASTTPPPVVEPVATKPIRLSSEALASTVYETYATSAPPSRPPKFWRFMNWFGFGTAGSEAK